LIPIDGKSLSRPSHPENGPQDSCHIIIDICLIISYIERIISLMKDAFGR
jgi:hypothetical protein